MARNQESIDWLYQQFKNRPEYNIGKTQQEFENALKHKEARDWLYEQAQSLGYNVGDQDTFNDLLGYGKVQQPTPSNNTQPQTQQTTPTAPQVPTPTPTTTTPNTKISGGGRGNTPTYTPANPSVANNPAPTNEEEYQTNLRKQQGEDVDNRNFIQKVVDGADNVLNSRPVKFARNVASKINPSTMALNKAADEMIDWAQRLTDGDEQKGRLAAAKGFNAEIANVQAGKERVQREVEKGNGDIDTNSAAYLYDKAEEILSAPSKYDGTKGLASFNQGIKNIRTGIKDNLFDRQFFATTDLYRNVHVSNLVEKLNKGEELNNNELELISAFVALDEARATRANDLSLGYKIGQGASESAPFMVDMLLTAGAGAVAKKSIVRYIERAYGKNVAAKYAKWLGGASGVNVGTRRAPEVLGAAEKVGKKEVGRYLAREAVETPLQTFSMPSSWANVYDEKIHSMLESGKDDWSWQDWRRAWGNMYVETLTERAGGKLIDMGLQKILPFGKIWSHKAGKTRTANDFIQSPIGETLEEYLGAGINYLRSFNPNFLEESNEQMRSEAESMFTVEGAAQTFGTVLPMSLLGGAVNLGNTYYSASSYDSARRRIERMLIQKGATPEQAENIMATMEGATDNEQYTDYINELTDNLITLGYTEEKAIDAANNLLNTYYGYNLNVAELNEQFSKLTPEQQEQAKQEMGESYAKIIMSVAFQENAQQAGTAPNVATPSNIDEATQNAANFLTDVFDVEEDQLIDLAQREPTNAREAYLKRQLQAQIEADQQVSPITAPDNNVYNVHLYSDTEKTGYIVGIVNQEGDGSLVVDDKDGQLSFDKTASASAVTIRFEDGSVQQVPLSDVALDSYQTKTGERLGLAATIQAKNTFTKGQEVVLLDQDGNPQGTSQVVDVLDDGSVVVEVEDPANPGNVIQTPMPANIALTSLVPVEDLAISERQSENSGVIFQDEDKNQYIFKPTEDGWVQVDEQGKPLSNMAYTEDELAKQGFTRAENEQPREESGRGQEPTYPTDTNGEPDFTQMDVAQGSQVVLDLLGGDKGSAKVWVEGKVKEAQKVQSDTSKKKVPANTPLTQFAAANAQLNAEKQAADAQVKYWQNIALAIQQYKTPEELAAEEEAQRKAAELRELRRRTLVGLVGENMAERYKAAPKIDGATGTKTTADGQVLKGHYVLVSPSGLTPSHDATQNFVKSNGYPTNENGSSINDRDYQNDKEEQEKVAQVAQTYNGLAVNDMPIVSDEGMVYSGNGRTMAGQLAAVKGTDAAYNDALIANATQFGFTPEQVASIPNARLVFQLDERLPYNTTSLALFNQSTQQAQSMIAAAAANVRKMTEQARGHIIRSVNTFDNGSQFFSDKNAPFELINLLIGDGMISDRDKAALVDQNGLLTPTGKDVLTTYLLGAAFNEETIRLMGDNPTLKNNVLNAIPQILTNKALGDFSLFNEINNAIKAMYEMKEKGLSYFEFTRQLDIEGKSAADKFSELELLLAERMISDGVEAFRNQIESYNKLAQGAAAGQMDMFADNSVPTKQDIVNQILGKYGKEQPAAGQPAKAEPAKLETPTPVASNESNGEVGFWGKVYNQFKGKAKEAAQFLIKQKEGTALSVFHRNDIGDINLTWGDSKGGLEHIINKHIIKLNDFNSVDEAIERIEDIINNGNITHSNQYKVIIEKDGYIAVLVRQLDGNFVLTSYDTTKGEKEKERTDSDATLVRQSIFGTENGTPVSPTVNSSDKGTTNNSNTQINTQKNEKNLSNGVNYEPLRVDGVPVEDGSLEQLKDQIKESGYNTEEPKAESQAEKSEAEKEMDALKAEAEQLEKELKDLLNQDQNLHAVNDPKANAERDIEILNKGGRLAIIYTKMGYLKFADFCEKMISTLGDAVRGYLRSFYMYVLNLPQNKNRLNEFDSFDTVMRFDVDNFKVKEVETPNAKETPQPKFKVGDRVFRFIDNRTAIEYEVKEVNSDGTYNLTNDKNVSEMSLNNMGVSEEDIVAIDDIDTMRKIYKPHFADILSKLDKKELKKIGDIRDNIQASVDKFENSIKNKSNVTSTDLNHLAQNLAQLDAIDDLLNGGTPHPKTATSESQNEESILINQNKVLPLQENVEEQPEQDGVINLADAAKAKLKEPKADKSGMASLFGDDNVEQHNNDNNGEPSIENVSGTAGRLASEKQPQAKHPKQGGVAGRSSESPANDENGSGGVAGQKLVSTTGNNKSNYHAGSDSVVPTTPKARFDANIAAIRLMKDLVESGKQATPEQKAILAKYSGWGGLGTFFNNQNSLEYATLNDLLDADEMHQAANSINTAYYTPKNIIDTMWDIVKRLGFKGGEVLEGSAGIGNILAQIPQDINGASHIEAVEYDQTTGNILKLLYPDAQVDIRGFQDTPIQPRSKDLVITNVPFDSHLKVTDEKNMDITKKFGLIHNFCIAKNVRALREGGIGVFITTSGTLDNNRDLFSWLSEHEQADVIGAFRLNNKTFEGAPVTSDIIVVRKRINNVPSSQAIDVSAVHVDRTIEIDTDPNNRFRSKKERENDTKKIQVRYNTYFAQHPENMGGEMKANAEVGETFRPESIGLHPSEKINQDKRVKDWANKFQEEQVAERIEQPQGVDTDEKEGAIVVGNDGKLMTVENGKLIPATFKYKKVGGHEVKEVVADYRAIQAALNNVLDYEINNETDDGLEPLLKQLNKAYDNFVSKYGYLHKNNSLSWLRNDVDYAYVAELETYKSKESQSGKITEIYGKADVMNHRVMNKAVEAKADNVRDAIIVSIRQKGLIDTDYISNLIGRDSSSIKKEILDSGLAFEDPANGQLVVKYEYLSGNIIDKIDIAKANNDDGRFDKNIEMLEEVKPRTIPAHVISVSLGTTWIDPSIYEEFIAEKTGNEKDNVRVNKVQGGWTVNAPAYPSKNRTDGIYSALCDKTITVLDLLTAAINNRSIVVSHLIDSGEVTESGNPKKTTEVDKVSTDACTARIDEYKDEFSKWFSEKMQNDKEMAAKMEDVYNRLYNQFVPVRVSKEFIPEHFDGASTDITLREWQSHAAVRATIEPLLFAHEVGAGKTFAMVTAVMEMRRLGQAKKPMIVVQNQTAKSFVSDARRLYPNAKILSLSDKDSGVEGRMAFYRKIKYNDWDMIIIPQSVFNMIPESLKRKEQFIQERIDEKIHVMELLAEEGGRENQIAAAKIAKEIEALQGEFEEDLAIEYLQREKGLNKKTAKAEMKKDADKIEGIKEKAKRQLVRKTDDIESFDDMDIDALFIDEAHEYKHLGFESMTGWGIKGIDKTSSRKAVSLFCKMQSVFEKTGHKNVVFATGTPISNTAAEVWTFMKYLIPKDVLVENEVYYFDDFIHNFGKIIQRPEFKTDGKFKPVTRFSEYNNVPELVRLWTRCSDTVLSPEGLKDLQPITEEGEHRAKDVFLPQTKSLRTIMKYVRKELEKYDNMTGKEKKEHSSIPLVMYGIASAAAIDPRLVIDSPDESNSKTNAVVRETLRALKDSEGQNGACVIFSDRIRRKENGVEVFNIFEDIKAKLIASGVPENQIAIISEQNRDQKQKIFDKVNEGEIRVVMGTTQKLGVGVNIQKRLFAELHLDAPNRPMDYQQRVGRMIRQGNLYKEWGIPVRLLRFGVEDSLDVTAYQRLKTKTSFSDSIMKLANDMNLDSKVIDGMDNRSMEEEEDMAGNFDNMIATISGSEFSLLISNEERKLRKLEAEKTQYINNQVWLENNIRSAESSIKYGKASAEQIKNRIATLNSKLDNGNVTNITINGADMSNAKVAEKVYKDINASIEDKLNHTSDYEIIQKGYISLSKQDVSINEINVEARCYVQLETDNSGKKQRHVHWVCKIPELVDYEIPCNGRWLKGVLSDIIDEHFSIDEQQKLLNATIKGIEENERDVAQYQEKQKQKWEKDDEIKKIQDNLVTLREKMQEEMEEKEKKYAELDKDVAEVDIDADNVVTEEDSEDDDDSENQITSDDLSNDTEAKQLATDAIVSLLDNVILEENDIESKNNSSEYLVISKNNSIFVPISDVPQEELAVAYKRLFALRNSEHNTTRIVSVYSAKYLHVFDGEQYIGALDLKEQFNDIVNIKQVIYEYKSTNSEGLSDWAKYVKRKYGKHNSSNADDRKVERKDDRTYDVHSGESSDERRDNGDGNQNDGDVEYQIVSDPIELNKLNSEPTIKVYRAMQLVDGKLYPPMAAIVDGKRVEPVELGVWEKAVERPDLVKDGKFILNKGSKGSKSTVPAAYNPYIHTSRSPLNDQFKSAWNRPELVTIETEIPESELTSGYKADGAKDAVGEVAWKSGSVSSKLAKVGKERKVILSRYDKPIRVLPTSEVASRIAELLQGEDIEIPVNTVNSELREELEKRGIKIGSPEKGMEGKVELQDKKGIVYGWYENGNIHIIKDRINPNTPIHEYTHMWARAMMKKNPEAWKSIVEVMKDTPFWNEVVNDPNYNLTSDDDICSEVLSRYSGRRGAKLFEEKAQEVLDEEKQNGNISRFAKLAAVIKKVKDAITKFWKWVGKDLFKIKRFTSAEEIADRILYDMINNTDLNPDPNGGGREFQLAPEHNPGESIPDYAARVKEFYDTQKVDASVREYNKFMAEQAKGKQRTYRAIFDAAAPIEDFQKWMVDRGAELNADNNAYQDVFLASGRISTFSERYNKNELRNMANAIRAILDSHKLDGIHLTWQNMEDAEGNPLDKVNGRVLTPQEILGVYAQAKDCDEAVRLGLPDRGQDGFTNNLGKTYQDVIREVELALDAKQLRSFWKSVNAATKFALKYELDGGFISQEVYDRYADRDYYVPQRGWIERDLDGESTEYIENGGTYNAPYNAALKKSKGRQSLASQPFAYIESIAESAISSTEQNKTKQKLLQFVMDNEQLGLETGAFHFSKFYVRHVFDENGELMYEADGEPKVEIVYNTPSAEDIAHDEELLNEISKLRKQLYKYKNALDLATTQVAQDAIQAKIDTLDAEIKDKYNHLIVAQGVKLDGLQHRTFSEKMQHVVNVIKDGENYVIWLRDERLANAVNKEYKKTSSKILDFLKTQRAVTRYLSAVRTQYNPEFALSNFSRDYQVALTTLMVEHPELVKDFIKNFNEALPTVTAYAYNDKIHKKDVFLNNKYGKYLDEYYQSGAQTGYSYLKDLKTARQNFDKMINDSNVKAGAVAAFESFSILTEISETAVRFAAYVAAREKGMDINDAAYLSKELTTNFDREGELTQYIKPWFSFFGASLNGNNKYYKGFRNFPKGYSIVAAAFLAMGLVNGLLQPDDPDKERWMSTYKRQSDFLFGKWHIPVAHFMRMFYALGTNISAAINGDKRKEEAMYDALMYAADEQLPNFTNVANFVEYDDASGKFNVSVENYMQGATPTIVSPLMDVWLNRDFMGLPLDGERYEYPGTRYKKDVDKHKKNAEIMYIKAADYIYNIFGNEKTQTTLGDNALADILDMSPSTYKSLLEGYITPIVPTIALMASDIESAIQGEDVQAKDIPFLRKFYSEYTPDRVQSSEYWQLNAKVKVFKEELNDYEKNDKEQYRELKRSEEYKIYEESSKLIEDIDIDKPATKENIVKLLNLNRRWNKAN